VSLDGVDNYTCRSNYVRAVTECSDAIPVLLPPIDGTDDIADLLGVIDGLLLTGSVSNVDPMYFGQPRDETRQYDPSRDAAVLPLIRAALLRKIPILGICRGLQEMNVALGGSLHQNLHQIEGLMDHREDESQPRSIQYAKAHGVYLAANGILSKLYGKDSLEVGSLHWQGIDRLADGLTVEAVAPDGLIEAVSVNFPEQFAVAIQWHPEWFLDAEDRRIFQAFAQAIERCKRVKESGAAADGSPQALPKGIQGGAEPTCFFPPHGPTS